MRNLFLLFIIVPFIEIYVLLKAGGIIGAGWTILAVITTAAIIGAALVKTQGFMTLNNVQNKMASGQVPAMEIAEGVAILVAGALLLTFGFCCLIPPLRKGIISAIFKSGVVKVQTSAGFGNSTSAPSGAGHSINGRAYSKGPSSKGSSVEGNVIEGEYHDIDKK